MQLSQLRVGSKALIIKLNPGESVYRQRLLAMGLLPGTEFTVSRIAPLGDPIEIIVRGFALSLRKSEANILEIEEITVDKDMIGNKVTRASREIKEDAEVPA